MSDAAKNILVERIVAIQSDSPNLDAFRNYLYGLPISALTERLKQLEAARNRVTNHAALARRRY